MNEDRQSVYILQELIYIDEHMVQSSNVMNGSWMGGLGGWICGSVNLCGDDCV